MSDPATERKTVPFARIRLNVGDSLHMQAVGTADQAHYPVRYMGGVADASLLTTLPLIDREPMWMRFNGEYIFRGLAGKYIYAFVAKLIKARAHPYPYAHFSWPETVEVRLVRRSPRIKVNLAGRCEKAGGATLPLSFIDLSLHGAMVEAGEPLGEIGEAVRITVPILLSEVNRELSLAADIRSVAGGEESRYGLEFHRLADDDVLLLHYFIDHQIAEAVT
ncbi:MAG: flagellar brake protein [Thiobacillus sp.]|nr:flagellar brake protein [Thiobacillus sp.]